ncbi:hypothetical protein [Streptomyces sp. NPDC020298]|uniref:hypothetical protein n=1 Tax=unclassified Streptomyces TaxID=2593676 RepID=UPI0033C053E1
MSGTAADVISIAKSQVGYHEGYSGGHWNNHQKYSPAVPGLEWSQDQAWCATFCAWVFQQAGMPKDSYPVTASVATARDWWKQKGRWSEYPAVGAQVIMGVHGDAHTGLCYAYDDDFVYTIEGNTNTSGSAEGDGVYLKQRARRDSYIYGYGYPAYPAGIVSADPNWKNPTPPPKEDPMPTPSDYAKAVLTLDGVIAVPGAPATNPTWTLSSVQTEILKRIDMVRAQEAAQTAAISKLAGLVGSGVDTAAVVAAVKAAIADAVVKVSVDVTGPVTKES